MLVHPSSGAWDLFVDLFHVLYCSGSMCVGVTVLTYMVVFIICLFWHFIMPSFNNNIKMYQPCMLWKFWHNDLQGQIWWQVSRFNRVEPLQFVHRQEVCRGTARPIMFIFYVYQRLQSKLLRTLANAPRYISNLQLHTDLGVSFVTAEIRRSSLRYHRRVAGHSNALVATLCTPPSVARRLKRRWSSDLHLWTDD